MISSITSQNALENTGNICDIILIDFIINPNVINRGKWHLKEMVYLFADNKFSFAGFDIRIGPGYIGIDYPSVCFRKWKQEKNNNKNSSTYHGSIKLEKWF